MDTNTPRSGWDVFLFGIPLIALLVFGFFRLDEVFTARKGRKQDRAPDFAAGAKTEIRCTAIPTGAPGTIPVRLEK